MKNNVRAPLTISIILLFILMGCIQGRQARQGIVGQVLASGIGVQMDCSHFTAKEDIEQCQRSNKPSTTALEGIAPIKVIDLENGESRTFISNQDGTYKIPLPVGEYQICAGSTGVCSYPIAVEEGEFVKYDVMFLRP